MKEEVKHKDQLIREQYSTIEDLKRTNRSIQEQLLNNQNTCWSCQNTLNQVLSTHRANTEPGITQEPNQIPSHQTSK
jgi:bacterioferritin-associated ferredoxin